LGFEIEKKEKPYNPEFLKGILEVVKDVREGNYVKIAMEELDNAAE
jgi:hypothetical protein